MKQKRKDNEEKRKKRGAIGEPAAEEKKTPLKRAGTSDEREHEMDQGASIKQQPNRGRRQCVWEHRIVGS
jgi:hypothetical protein